MAMFGSRNGSFTFITSTHPISTRNSFQSKELTEAQMEVMGINVEDSRCYLKVKLKFTHEQKELSISDAVKAEGVEFYKQTYHQLMNFLNKSSKKP
jgi:hypothetical protein